MRKAKGVFCHPLNSHTLPFTTSSCVPSVAKKTRQIAQVTLKVHYDTRTRSWPPPTSPNAKTLPHHIINLKALSVGAARAAPTRATSCVGVLCFEMQNLQTLKGTASSVLALCLLYRSHISEPQENILTLIFKCVFVHLVWLKTFIHLYFCSLFLFTTVCFFL